MRYSFVIDQSRCIGCHACSLACKAEHDVPLGSYRTWVKYVEKGRFPDVRRFFSVLRCNHCDDAPCVTICPVTALYRRDDGIVDFDRDVCIGCKGCMQACPYDALYIHPEHGTAEKCNFCAHRVDVGLEPPCATVCPAEAILVGDVDDPESRVGRLVATEQVSVRKPEKGTRPKVFYIDAEPRALTPGASDPSGGYLWADGPGRPGARISYQEVGAEAGSVGTVATASSNGATTGPATAGAGDAGTAGAGSDRARGGPDSWLGTDMPPAAAAQAAAAAGAAGEDLFFQGAWAGLSPARTVYDVDHAESPWGAKVSAYLWTKSIAAGAFLMASLAPLLGIGPAPALDLGAPLLGLLFLAITGVLLVADLKRPERFWTILTRPNWDSWLARGAFIITGFGIVGAAWTGAVAAGLVGQLDPARLLDWLRWPLAALAAAAAGYTGYLFAQAKGRDFWQSPLLPLHLVVQALAAGAAASLPLAVWSGVDATPLARTLAVALGVNLGLVFFGEVSVAHATRDGALAARAMTRGRYAGAFWTAVVLEVGAIGLATALIPGPTVTVLCAGAALVGLALYEHAWNLAGQSPPLS